jgi:hypothetical protein
MIRITSNIDELQHHLDSVFKKMMKSPELQVAGTDAGQAIGRHVGDTLIEGGDSGYSYEQSGGLQELVSEESRYPQIKQTQNKVSIGVFDVSNMNNANIAKRNWQYQYHDVWDSKEHMLTRKMISLKEEDQMPKWVLAESGTGQYRDGDLNLSRYGINYTERDKPYMFGPSIGGVGGPGGGQKRGFFMVTNSTLLNLLGPNRAQQLDSHREHEGIKAGHVFSKGLDSAREEVFDILGGGVQAYLDKNTIGG